MEWFILIAFLFGSVIVEVFSEAGEGVLGGFNASVAVH